MGGIHATSEIIAYVQNLAFFAKLRAQSLRHAEPMMSIENTGLSDFERPLTVTVATAKQLRQPSWPRRRGSLRTGDHHE
jgi:hypothetical protein